MASSSTAANTSKAPMQDYHPGNPAQNLATEAAGSSAPKKKKKKHRGGKKRNRRQSFAAPPGQLHPAEMTEDTQSLLSAADETAARASFYRIARGNDSNTSLESEALLDHRDQGPLNARRQSIQQSIYGQRNAPYARHPSHLSQTNPFSSPTQSRPKLSRPVKSSSRDSDGEDDSADDRTPLMSTSRKESPSRPSYGGFMGRTNSSHDRDFHRPSTASSRSSQKRKTIFEGSNQGLSVPGEYDVNNPPSVPGSPVLGPDMGYEDLMLPRRSTSPGIRSGDALGNNVIINIDEPDTPTPMEASLSKRRQTISGLPILEDVCFPLDNMSEIGNEDAQQRESEEPRPRRRRTRKWPHLPVLEEWSREEKEQRTMGGVRTRKVSEPLMVGGRLRPQKQVWHREDDDAPYRFTYFNEEFQSTVHSQTISELVQSGQTFRDLFIPERPVLSDSSSGEDDEDDLLTGGALLPDLGNNDTMNNEIKGVKSPPPGTSQAKGEDISSPGPTKINSSGEQTRSQSPHMSPKQKRYGPRPVFWLDVLSPTDEEMRVISKAFGIHPLTAEDIMMQEAREKVELFRHYYFVNYRTFEQDTNSEDYLEPVNMYVVVFREGVISFHFSLTPHPANVRRRIRQLSDYLILSSDWISYAIIDDITDVYAPLIERIEDEVDNIDDEILQMHTGDDNAEPKPSHKDKSKNDFEKESDAGESLGSSDGNMLRRVGECRKKVMGLYRLLGNKADVIKGFAKRCNEQWDVAPRSEIGLYLGDIQDHIVTMTGNLSHYENLLSRAHSNYLTQVNLKMSDRAERNADILGKLTVLGTIVLPLNIVTGLFGMNTRVPGETGEGLSWFWGITGGMAAFAIVCYFIAKKMYGIV